MAKKQSLTLQQVRGQIRRGATVVPLVREIPADTLTPVGAYLRAARGRDSGFLLESVEGGEHTARYSFLGARPFETLTVENGQALSHRASERILLPGNPFDALGQRLERYQALQDNDLPPFTGGAVGHLGYEMMRYAEPKTALPASVGIEAKLELFAQVAAFDQVRHRLLLISNVICDSGSLARNYRIATDGLDDMESRLSKAAPSINRRAPSRRVTAKPTLGRSAFMAGVRHLKSQIRRGEIFQAVLSENFTMPLESAPFSVYRRLRAINPSPYMFYIGSPKDAVLGASPEMLVRATGRDIETRPIAGTRRRGKNDDEDRRHEKNLLASVKERAEHVMLVDLGRNDLGRVAAPGSVRVAQFAGVERYSHVMHMVSSVRGRLAKNLRAWDAFKACFPAGTVTGAPKIRAMQLVGEIEGRPRGLYAGAVVYRGFRGDLDSAIAIRSLAVRNGIARVQAGAGIVADSRPQAEWDEVHAKAGAMLEAIRQAQS
jgi:anthranilate synthase component 1